MEQDSTSTDVCTTFVAKGGDIYGLLGLGGILYIDELARFRDMVKMREKNMNCQEIGKKKIPLSKLWNGIDELNDFSIANVFLRFDVLGDVYWEDLNRQYFGEDIEARVKRFYEMPATRDQNKVIAKKLQNLEIYDAKLKE